MKTIIAGGRSYQFTPEDIAFLDELVDDISEVVSGGCSGADREGERWARANGKPVKVFPAAWHEHGKAAGPIRNREMAQYADCLIAFPGGRGTRSMLEIAEEEGLVIRRLDSPGTSASMASESPASAAGEKPPAGC